MTDREMRVIESSLKLFKIFGFQKVTMGDIAESVGISRPTLYSMFPNKPSIFGSLVVSHFDEISAKTDARLKKAKSLKEKLDVIFDLWIITPVSQAFASEETRFIVANCETYAPEAVKEMYDRMENYLLQAIKSETDHSPKAKDAAKILKEAAKGLKVNTTDIEDLKRSLKIMNQMTTSLFLKE